MTTGSSWVDPGFTVNPGGISATDIAAQDLATSWGLTEALLNDPVYGPELRNVATLLAQKNYSGATAALQKTKFYQNNSATVASRLKLKASQPGAYQQSLDQYLLAQKKRLTNAGVKVDSTLDAILKKAYDSGLDDNQLDATIMQSSSFTARLGGTTGGTVADLKTYAAAFGMSYGQTFWDTYSKDLFAGTTTTQDIQAKIRQDAASAFPGYAEQINNGTSIDALASAYKSSMANILEIDPDSISYNDPTLRKALQYVDSTGKAAVKPLWQFEQELRSDPRWEYTNNARATVDSLSLKVLKDWGLA